MIPFRRIEQAPALGTPLVAIVADLTVADVEHAAIDDPASTAAGAGPIARKCTWRRVTVPSLRSAPPLPLPPWQREVLELHDAGRSDMGEPRTCHRVARVMTVVAAVSPRSVSAARKHGKGRGHGGIVRAWQGIRACRQEQAIVLAVGIRLLHGIEQTGHIATGERGGFPGQGDKKHREYKPS